MPITDFMGVIAACLVADGCDADDVKEIADMFRQIAATRSDLVDRYNVALADRSAGEMERLWFECRLILKPWHSSLRINGATGRIHIGNGHRSYPLFPPVFQIWPPA